MRRVGVSGIPFRYRAMRYGYGMAQPLVDQDLPLDAVVIANIRAEVARRGWTRAEAAHRLGMSQQAFSDRMTGRSRLTVNELGRVADVLHLNPAQLLVRPEGFEPPTF